MTRLPFRTHRSSDLPGEFLRHNGDVFAVFDQRTQDSGNVSYGVRVDGVPYFVKTAGPPDDPGSAPHADRVAFLRNAILVSDSCSHPALPELHGAIESPWGPMLVYDWADGELLHANSADRDNPSSAFQRFRRLPANEILEALDVIYDVHHQLAERGWIAVDFYDGCLIYDFPAHRLHLVDLDLYCQKPFTNQMGRMFGSSRFMAPEEFRKGALIDQRTTVFTLGRTAAVFLSDGTLDWAPFRASDALHGVIECACEPDPAARHPTVAAFRNAWIAARKAEN